MVTAKQVTMMRETRMRWWNILWTLFANFSFATPDKGRRQAVTEGHLAGEPADVAKVAR